MKDKNLAKQDFIEMIKKSWTWAKLTQEERQTFLDLLEHPQGKEVIKGGYGERYEACDCLYYAFLCGLGYSKAPADWRDDRYTISTQFEINYDRAGEASVPLISTDEKQATRLYNSLKADRRNSNVTLTRVETATQRAEVR